jgi:LuxR family maltose regulon positive regulatory protein
MLTQNNVRDPALALKASPPRATKAFLERSRFLFSRIESNGASAVALLAPAGFGKTAQLVQWRREALSRGALTFWLTADERDEPHRFVQGLAYAARELAGKRGFDSTFMEWLDACNDPMSALTGWLAEVARLAVDVLLTIDDVEQLPEATRTESLAYLLGNAPSNLFIALGVRPSGALSELGILNKTRVTQFGASELRFTQEETSKLVAEALETRFTPEIAIRLHELTEGWPLGVQMAVSALHSIADPQELLNTVAKDIRKYFIDALIDQQPIETQKMLVLMADFEVIHPDLCKHVIGDTSSLVELKRLIDASPLFIQAEGSEWMRFHPIARDALRERLALEKPAKRKSISKSAGTWYAEHRLFQEAAHILRATGDKKGALEMASHCMREMVMQGRTAAVFEWIKSFDIDDIKNRADFLIPAAWSFAMSDSPTDAQPMIDYLLAIPQLSIEDQLEVDLIKSATASYIDDFELQAEATANWSTPPNDARPQSIPIFWTAKAFEALFHGKPDQARMHFGKVARLDRSLAYTPSAYGFVDSGIALSHLWEARYTLAEQVLRPALARAEERMERRNPIACMIATLLAQTCWEIGLTDEAKNLLALRLDVLERNGFPDALISAHCTLAAIANSEHKQDQALNILESLQTLGELRNVIRYKTTSLLEQVKLHLQYGRIETAERLSTQLAFIAKSSNKTKSSVANTLLEIQVEIARAHIRLSEGGINHLTASLQASQAAISLCESIKRGPESIHAKALRAKALKRLNYADAPSAMQEVISLSQASGMVRFVQELQSSTSDTTSIQIEKSAPAAKSTFTSQESEIAGTALLTAKERDILLGLVRNLSNKEIAIASSVSEQTVKWHMKNLFSKLNAANRKHAVARAHLLGLIVKAE